MESSGYREACEAVATAFVDAFVGYVAERLGDSAAIRDAANEGRGRLDEAMSSWAAEPATVQRSSPLELFREALAVPTAAAAAAGREPADRDEAAGDVVPGDVFDLAPMTSRDLGDEAWQAHVRWGLLRARVVAGVVPRPPAPTAGATAAVVGTDLMDRSKLEAAAEAAGYTLLVWRNPGAIERGLDDAAPAVVFVDLSHAASYDAIRTLAGAGLHVVAYGPHVDDHALAAARALGAQEALARSVFFRRLPGLFPAAT
jgi:hypothetical protein